MSLTIVVGTHFTDQLCSKPNSKFCTKITTGWLSGVDFQYILEENLHVILAHALWAVEFFKKNTTNEMTRMK